MHGFRYFVQYGQYLFWVRGEEAVAPFPYPYIQFLSTWNCFQVPSWYFQQWTATFQVRYGNINIIVKFWDVLLFFQTMPTHHVFSIWCIYRLLLFLYMCVFNYSKERDQHRSVMWHTSSVTSIHWKSIFIYISSWYRLDGFDMKLYSCIIQCHVVCCPHAQLQQDYCP
jgi:hypothetical protein